MGDGVAQLGVGDALDHGLDRGWERHLGGRRAHLGARGRALGRVDGADLEAELGDVDAAPAELGEDGVGEERELLRPGRRGDGRLR